MARPKKKEKKAMSFRIDSDVARKLDQYCEDTGVPKTVVVEKSIDAYVDRYYEDQQKLGQINNGTDGHTEELLDS